MTNSGIWGIPHVGENSEGLAFWSMPETTCDGFSDAKLPGERLQGHPAGEPPEASHQRNVRIGSGRDQRDADERRTMPAGYGSKLLTPVWGGSFIYIYTYVVI